MSVHRHTCTIQDRLNPEELVVKGSNLGSGWKKRRGTGRSTFCRLSVLVQLVTPQVSWWQLDTFIPPAIFGLGKNSSKTHYIQKGLEMNSYNFALLLSPSRKLEHCVENQQHSTWCPGTPTVRPHAHAPPSLFLTDVVPRGHFPMVQPAIKLRGQIVIAETVSADCPLRTLPRTGQKRVSWKGSIFRNGDQF